MKQHAVKAASVPPAKDKNTKIGSIKRDCCFSTVLFQLVKFHCTFMENIGK